MWAIMGALQAILGIVALLLLTSMFVIAIPTVLRPLFAWAVRLTRAVLVMLRPPCEALIAFARTEMAAWPIRVVWITAIFQITALAMFVYAVRDELSLIWLIVALLVYPLVACALAVSLIMRLPTPRALWNDISIKVLLFGSQVISLFVAKGAANNWLGDMWQISATNVPLAHAAATGFMMLLVIVFPLLFVVFFFEVLFFVSLWTAIASPNDPATQKSPINCDVFAVRASSNSLTPEKRGRRPVWVALATFITFLACLISIFALAELPGTRLTSSFLASVAFELDAVPADRCELTPMDRDAARKEDPDVKVIFLSTTQEKALVVRRAEHLYKPMTFREFRNRGGGEKNLIIGETVACFRLTADSKKNSNEGVKK